MEIKLREKEKFMDCELDFKKIKENLFIFAVFFNKFLNRKEHKNAKN